MGPREKLEARSRKVPLDTATLSRPRSPFLDLHAHISSHILPHSCTCALALECRDGIRPLFQLSLQPYVDMIDEVGEQGQGEGNGRTVLLGS